MDAGNRTVSWLQVSGLRILAAGFYTFARDPRFTAHYMAGAARGVWVLRIRGVLPRDAGGYQCQVAGERPEVRGVTLVLGEEGEEVVKEREEPVVQSIARALQRGGGGRESGGVEEGRVGGSLAVAGACLTMVLLCLVTLGGVRTYRGVEGERPGSRAGSRGRGRGRAEVRRSVRSLPGEVGRAGRAGSFPPP